MNGGLLAAHEKYPTDCTAPAVVPFEDDQTKVTVALARLIRAALEDSAADMDGGSYYGDHDQRERRKKRVAAAGERAKVLRRLRDEFELAMAGAVLA